MRKSRYGEGTRRWKGKAKDKYGCEFPYDAYAIRYINVHIGDWEDDMLYVCPWWPDEKFKTLEELKSWISNK